MATAGGAVARASREIARQGRLHTATLLAETKDPHAELLTLIWGPQFDREHALSLWARFSLCQPAQAVRLLPVLMSVGERFDALARVEKDRLRRMIVRHRALSK